jgi:hypothetical protein
VGITLCFGCVGVLAAVAFFHPAAEDFAVSSTTPVVNHSHRASRTRIVDRFDATESYEGVYG